MHTKEQLLTKKILNWYDLNKRSLPWRKDVSFKKKQYYTLVSEFMLQQTQVVTVIPYFKRFIKFIPNLNSLANISMVDMEFIFFNIITDICCRKERPITPIPVKD